MNASGGLILRGLPNPSVSLAIPGAGHGDLFPISIFVRARPAIDLCSAVPTIETTKIRNRLRYCAIGSGAMGASKDYCDAS